MIDSINELINILQILLGPNGCPWDRKQTLLSLRETLVEETYEVIDAIDSQNGMLIQEELGDLLLNAVFLMLLAEKEGKCSAESIVKTLCAKLIRRHPHVFSENKDTNMSMDDFYKQWDTIKASEKGKEERKHFLDGIPKHLPALALAQKVLKKLKRENTPYQITGNDTETEIGQELISVVERALEKNVDVEHALRKVIKTIDLKE